MYKKNNPSKTTLKVNKMYEGETIEQKVHRVTTNKEPITDGAAIIYTERKDGVQPGYNIKTDKWEVAIDAMQKVTQNELAKRKARQEKTETKIIDINKKDGGAEPLQTNQSEPK